MTSSVAELILRNGDVHTIDPAFPRAKAVAVREGRIVEVGTDDEVRELAASRTGLDLVQ